VGALEERLEDAASSDLINISLKTLDICHPVKIRHYVDIFTICDDLFLKTPGVEEDWAPQT
jgi:hypothetical protein